MSTPTDELAELHGDLAAVARDVLGATPGGVADWRVVASAGWLGLEVPGALDGADATFAEVAVVLREIGRAAARGGYPAVAGLAIAALDATVTCEARDRMVRHTVAGESVPIIVLEGERLCGNRFHLETTPHGRFVLGGSADFVLDAPAADHLLVPVVTPDGRGRLVVVDPAATGVTVEPRPVVDDTRTFGRVAAVDVDVAAEAVWPIRAGIGDLPGLLRDRAAVAVACDSLGLAEAMLDTTVAYVGVREQFGRKIGSFQAVKHACADMLVEITVARKLVDSAVRQVTDGTPGASVAAAMAASYSAEMAVRVAGKAMQLHGGIGYTWESGVHVYLKRATLNRSLFGSAARHRARIAERYRPLVATPPVG
ncbi:acyl-CoA dehydrogenase family protein [Gordonia insulae]|uniref:Caffeyl-CoA reductase-Etf complex subunit CarC n=1 Tax=Gordonia insulae TaxID=2420509 RepID=A0A3G8JLP4_9ACTN|nr:acyl-CoA dehydrogenase family protein [Gordonia insulae]AZG45130.1 Caffeyl-CoA reductase-Etf complex subunit CarC [Gordonia insulae]